MEKKKFSPNEHLIEIKRKQKQPDGTWVSVATKYLPVAARLLWFREERPDWRIRTKVVDRGNGWALMRAEIRDANGNLMASAHKAETKENFNDYLEKAETGAVGRALAMCGFGTQFAPEFEEGQERVVDAPAPVEGPRRVGALASEKQRKFIFKLGQNLGMTPEAVKKKVRVKFGLDSFTELTKEQASEMIEELMGAGRGETVAPEEIPEDLGRDDTIPF